MWKALKELNITNKSKTQTSNIGLRNEGGEIIFEKNLVANKLNKYFAEIASVLVSHIPTGPNFDIDFNEINSYYSKLGVSENCFEIKPVLPIEINNLLQGLNTCKATGLDNISARFLKDGAPILAIPICHIFNLSIAQSIFPDKFKNAKIIPLFKKGDKFSEGNYRPISILPVMSKIFERIVHNQIYHYCDRNKIIFQNQSGFRQGFSTETALLYLSDNVRNNLDKQNFTGMLMIDLQKAFDTVNHKILILKLKAMGFSSNCVNLFKSYLSQRSQYVEIGGVLSNPLDITCGVPQGSILGPLLFLLYINDMSSAITKSKLFLYADDSAIIYSDKSTKEIEKHLTTDLESLNTWLAKNKLSLHLGKTECIFFSSKKRKVQDNTINITCKNQKINVVHNIKYLGAQLDYCLSGQNMYEQIIKKVNSALKYLYRKKDFLSQKLKKNITNALIQPHFDYGSCFWYPSLNITQKKSLQKLQNKCIRFILQLNNRTHIEKCHFQKLNLLNVDKRVAFLTTNHVFNIKQKIAPEYLVNMFNHTLHSYQTRNSLFSFHVPHVKKYGKSTLSYNGPTLWNNLPNNIKNVTNKNSFKFKLKKYLLQNMEIF
jgi:hypothetical protein